ncbi:MAG TPA: tetratricopeptide repeat protein [Kiritimatiellia bacterium]|jgi:tetratricopeptide (TPR) repeat protein
MKSEAAHPDTKGRWLEAIGLAAIAAFALRTISNSEVWMHLATGRWILEHGLPRNDVFSFATDAARPWINASWLYDVVLFLLWKAGAAPLLVFVHAAAAVAAFWILLPVARKWAGPAGAAAGLVLCAWMLAPNLRVAPSVFSYVMAALVLRMLASQASPRRMALILVPTQIAWANCSLSFVLGPAFAALFALEAKFSADEPLRATWKSKAALAAALALCTLVNPYGPGLWRHAASAVLDPDYMPLLNNVSPLRAFFTWGGWKAVAPVAIALTAAGFVLHRGRLPVALTALAVVSAFSLVRWSGRFDDFCAVASFPFLALSITALGTSAATAWRKSTGVGDTALRTAALGALALAAALSVFAATSNYFYNRSGSASSFGWTVQKGLFPSERVLAIVDGFGTNPVLHVAMDGDYFAWQQPERRVFVDSRGSLYGAAFYEQLQRSLLGDAKTWDALVEKWQPAALVINATWSGAAIAIGRLALSGQWRLAYFDGTSAVLAAPVSQNKDLIVDAGVKESGLNALEAEHQAYKKLVDERWFAPHSGPVIGAATVFQSVSSFREALALYELLERGAPTMLEGRLNRGFCLVQMGRSEEGVALLESLAGEAKNDVQYWVRLSGAYRNMGRLDDAANAENRARTINERLAAMLLNTNAPHR